MPAYVLVRSDALETGPDLRSYVEQVDATLDAHGARILVQRFPDEVRLGEWPGFITLLEFPSLEQARTWYDSAEYRAIRPLRVNSSQPTDVLVDGVAAGHRSSDLLKLFAPTTD